LDVNWQSGRPEDLFARATWVVELRRRGWTYRELASQASLDNARSFDPDATDEELARLSRSKGVSVSESNMSHYEKAWQDVAAAGFDPDPASVGLSYQLAFRGGGSRDRRRALAAEARRLDPTKARDYFINAGRVLMREYPAGGEGSP
jgi:hypothetical protein